jgi:hypothetical protein
MSLQKLLQNLLLRWLKHTLPLPLPLQKLWPRLILVLQLKWPLP